MGRKSFTRGVRILGGCIAVVLATSALSMGATGMPAVSDSPESGLHTDGSPQSALVGDGRTENPSQSGSTPTHSEANRPTIRTGKADPEAGIQDLNATAENNKAPVQRGLEHLRDISLPSHYGPSPGVPYRSKYTGNVSAQVPTPVKFDPTQLYAAGYFYLGNANSGVAPISSDVLQSSSNGLNGLFTTWGPGSEGSGIGSRSNDGGDTWNGGPISEVASTMALDAGRYGRTGKSYFWFWGTPTSTAGSWNPARPGNANVPIAVFYNDPDDVPLELNNPQNNKPSEVLFVPLPGSPGLNYWSGGEVHQPTGRLYFSGGEDSTVGSANYRFMIYDPTTGDYRIISDIKPKTSNDATVNGWYGSSDMAIDGQGNIYTIVFASDSGEKWMIKIEPSDPSNQDAGWVYSKVVKWQNQNGTNPQAIEIWGMAFHEGKVYFTAGGYPSYVYLVEGDPLTGYVRQISGRAGSTIFDLAADGSMSTINGIVYQDQNRNGAQDQGEAGVENQLVQIYDSTGKVVGQQTTNESGEYSFLLGFQVGNTYRVRVVQPQINKGTAALPVPVNATQTGITFSSYVPAGDPDANDIVISSFGEVVAEATPPSLTDGGYIDYPSQHGAGTASAESLSVEKMALCADITLNSDLDVSSVNFGINAEGSWGDAGANLANYRTSAANNGPRHINPGNWTDDSGNFSEAVKANPSLYLGSAPGWYSDGVTTGARNETEDGVHLLLGEVQTPLANQLMVPGVEYSLKAALSGVNAEEGVVRAWLQNPTVPVSSPAFTEAASAIGTGSGNTRNLAITSPSGAVNSAAMDKYIRVVATSSTDSAGFWNGATPSTQWFAPSKGTIESQTRPWIIDGEVEDYAVKFANGVVRVIVEGAPGTYTVSTFTNATGTAASATVLTDPKLIGSYAVTNNSQNVAFDLKMPAGALIEGASVTKVDGTELEASLVTLGTPANDTVRVTLNAQALGTNGSPDATIIVRTTTLPKVAGTIEVGFPAENGTPAPSNWEVTATNSEDTAIVISGRAGDGYADLTPGSYVIGGRQVTAPGTIADKYVQQSVACSVADIGGDEKPDAFEDATFTLTLEAGDVADCKVTYMASTVSLINNPIGITATGWGTSGANKTDGAQYDFTITQAGPQSALVARPGTYDMTATLPSGIALIGLQRFDSTDPVCAPFLNDPASADEACWLDFENDLEILPGLEEVIRITATSPEGMPGLPNAGGLGTYRFVAGASIFMVTAGLIYALWRRQRNRIERTS